MKVLHLPADVGGNAWGLAQGEKQLGLNSEVFYTYASKIGYPSTCSLDLSYDMPRWIRLWKELRMFFNIRSKYDVFHFNGGSSLLPLRSNDIFRFIDLKGYPKKAKLFVTYQGCDARQKDISRQRTLISPCQNAQCTNDLCNFGKKDEIRRKCISNMSDHVLHMWALNPDLLYFLPREKSSFLPYTVAHYAPEKHSIGLNKKLTIVHAPTHQIIKGSSIIKKAIENLNYKYSNAFDIIWVENMSHQKALQAYRQADLIIDQVLIGWYGAFAVEAMLMGKPVLARIAQEDLHFIPEQMRKDLQDAVINASPENLEEVLEQCLLERKWLQQKAENCFAYAQKWHNPLYIASLTKEKYHSL